MEFGRKDFDPDPDPDDYSGTLIPGHRFNVGLSCRLPGRCPFLYTGPVQRLGSVPFSVGISTPLLCPAMSDIGGLPMGNGDTYPGPN